MASIAIARLCACMQAAITSTLGVEGCTLRVIFIRNLGTHQDGFQPSIYGHDKV